MRKSILSLYGSEEGKESLKEMFDTASADNDFGLPAEFLEKDLWITEVLNILFEQNIFGELDVAFKGGTCLSKCWNVIQRFSEDIDLTIHWYSLAENNGLAEDDLWEKTTASGSQNSKFEKEQKEKLAEWLDSFLKEFNKLASSYDIVDFEAEMLDRDNGKVQIKYPKVTDQNSTNTLSYILLEFGARNRGLPSTTVLVKSYVQDDDINYEFPVANVKSFDKGYMFWEKLTALHQLCHTKEDKIERKLTRSARHWYDVYMLLMSDFLHPNFYTDAATNVVDMKSNRFRESGVDYKKCIGGEIKLIPNGKVLDKIERDYREMVDSLMFFSNSAPDFEEILKVIKEAENSINQNFKS